MIKHRFTHPQRAWFGNAIVTIAISLLSFSSYVVAAGAQPSGCLNPQEQQFERLLNNYRASRGLPAIPVTRSLTEVAQWHVIDLNENNPTGGDCNLHSWSNARPDLWSAVCYTPDHRNARGMWDKPREISKGAFSGNGYEISYWNSGGATAENALRGWQNSAGHNAVMINESIWQRLTWRAVGIGFDGPNAVVWFSDSADSRGEVSACGNSEPELEPERETPMFSGGFE